MSDEEKEEEKKKDEVVGGKNRMKKKRSRPNVPERCFICASPEMSKEINYKAILK